MSQYLSAASFSYSAPCSSLFIYRYSIFLISFSVYPPRLLSSGMLPFAILLLRTVYILHRRHNKTTLVNKLGWMLSSVALSCSTLRVCCVPNSSTWLQSYIHSSVFAHFITLVIVIYIYLNRVLQQTSST